MNYVKIALVVVPFLYVRNRLNKIESSIKDLKKSLRGGKLLAKAEDVFNTLTDKASSK